MPCYPSDLPDEQWAVLEPRALLDVQTRGAAQFQRPVDGVSVREMSVGPGVIEYKIE
jgi:hypothetical protein